MLKDFSKDTMMYWQFGKWIESQKPIDHQLNAQPTEIALLVAEAKIL